MTITLNSIAAAVTQKFGEQVACLQEYDELTINIAASSLIELCNMLKSSPYGFMQLIDLAGIDYLEYKAKQHPSRFAVAYHLLSHSNNLRLTIKCYCLEANEYCSHCTDVISGYTCNLCGAIAPNLPSVVKVWTVANWYEREAFDLFGIIFNGHPALTRILTEDDVGGHALRKDFPMVGKTERYYDEECAEVKSTIVSIEDRTVIQKTSAAGCMAKHRQMD